MTEPDMPRDPDLDVGVIDRYFNGAAEGVSIEGGITWGVRTILEDRAGGRYVGTFDPPEAALEYARDLMAEAWRAIEQRHGPKVWISPKPQSRTYLATASTEERRAALDPKTCPHCGVVEGRAFEPRHHPESCASLVAWRAAQAAQADPEE